MGYITPKPNSWFINKHINECNSLFSHTEEDMYIQAFACKCGKEHIRIANCKVHKVPYFICENCQNGHFIDTYNFDHTQDPLDINLDTQTIIQKKDEIAIEFAFKMPYGINLASDSILYTSYNVLKFVYKDSYIHIIKNCYHISSELDDALKETAIEILTRYKYPSAISKSLRYKSMLLRFDANIPSFLHQWTIDDSLYKDIQITKSDTVIDILDKIRDNYNQRSLKKALFERYKKEMAYYHKFDAITPYIIFRSFDNIDIIHKLLTSHISYIDKALNEHEKLIFDDTSGYDKFSHGVISLIKFLKKHFSEITISKLLLSISYNNHQIWIDSIRLFLYTKLEQNIQLPSTLSMHTLHDYLMLNNKLSYYEGQNHDFIYPSKFKKLCTTIDDMSFKLAKNPVELIMWGNELKNCLHTYISTVKSKRSIIFGAFKDNKLLYAIEIYRNSISQCYGKYNTPLNKEDKPTIQKWIKELQT